MGSNDTSGTQLQHRIHTHTAGQFESVRVNVKHVHSRYRCAPVRFLKSYIDGCEEAVTLAAHNKFSRFLRKNIFAKNGMSFLNLCSISVPT
ncbi:UNVERIFIED_CONTAM: hypothetical protein FKN15_025025 [Acipenser sinensis]